MKSQLTVMKKFLKDELMSILYFSKGKENIAKRLEWYAKDLEKRGK